jgi:oxygen-independent coproporphyrinogen-3 oxidase
LPHQRLIPVEVLPKQEERFLLNKMTQQKLTEIGFIEIGLDHYVAPNDRLAKQFKNREVSRNFQGYTTDQAATLLGFGVSAISEFKQGYSQNLSNTRQYYQAISKGHHPVSRGLVFNPDDLIRAQIIEQIMCSGQLELFSLDGGTETALGIWIESLDRLKHLEAAGLVRLGAERLEATKAGKMFLRVIAQVFDVYSSDNSTRHAAAI